MIDSSRVCQMGAVEMALQNGDALQQFMVRSNAPPIEKEHLKLIKQHDPKEGHELGCAAPICGSLRRLCNRVIRRVNEKMPLGQPIDAKGAVTELPSHIDDFPFEAKFGADTFDSTAASDKVQFTATTYHNGRLFGFYDYGADCGGRTDCDGKDVYDLAARLCA